MELAWTDDLSVGNSMIDADHKILLDMVNGVVHAIEMSDCSALSQASELLENRLRIHFAHEENIARAVKFPFAKHKLAQHYFLKELDLLIDELEARNCVFCEDAAEHYSNSLSGLLLDHITKKDMLMKPVLQSYPYHFSPILS